MPDRQRQGPQTFAAPAPQATLQQGGITNPAQNSFGIIGGNHRYGGGFSGTSMGGPDQGPSLIDGLLAIGGAILQPKVEAARARAATDGAMKALQGVSAHEIQQSEFLNGLFGDSTAVSAAREIERIDAVSRLESDLLSNMNDIQRMSGEEFRGFLPQQLEAILTGDPNTDALIQMDFMARLPKMVDMHTKANITYQAERAKASTKDRIVAEGRLLSTYLALGDQISNDMKLQQVETFIQALAGPEGISNPAYGEIIEETYKRFSLDGNLDAMLLMKESGVLDAALDEDTLFSLHGVWDQAAEARRQANPYAAGDMGDRGAFEYALDKGLTGLSLQGLDEYIDYWNSTPGGQGKGKIDMDERTRLHKRWYQGRDAAQVRPKDRGYSQLAAARARDLNRLTDQNAVDTGGESSGEYATWAVQGILAGGERREEALSVITDPANSGTRVQTVVGPVSRTLDAITGGGVPTETDLAFTLSLMQDDLGRDAVRVSVGIDGLGRLMSLKHMGRLDPTTINSAANLAISRAGTGMGPTTIPPEAIERFMVDMTDGRWLGLFGEREFASLNEEGKEELGHLLRNFMRNENETGNWNDIDALGAAARGNLKQLVVPLFGRPVLRGSLEKLFTGIRDTGGPDLDKWDSNSVVEAGIENAILARVRSIAGDVRRVKNVEVEWFDVGQEGIKIRFNSDNWADTFTLRWDEAGEAIKDAQKLTPRERRAARDTERYMAYRQRVLGPTYDPERQQRPQR